MSHLVPDRENVRRAIKWISEQRKEDPQRGLVTLVDEAAKQFDLGPIDAEFLWTALGDKKQQT